MGGTGGAGPSWCVPSGAALPPLGRRQGQGLQSTKEGFIFQGGGKGGRLKSSFENQELLIQLS